MLAFNATCSEEDSVAATAFAQEPAGLRLRFVGRYQEVDVAAADSTPFAHLSLTSPAVLKNSTHCTSVA
jgi:hypothetical protein